MNSAKILSPTPTTKGVRIILFIASLLVLTVGIPLYLMPKQTEVYFAWTINPPLTATFLGAGYWSSFLLELLSSREKVWARARLAVPAVGLFTTLTLIVTLIHLDKFHFNAPRFTTVLGTWVWLAIYAFVPIVLGFLWFQQVRETKVEPERVAPLPTLFRAVLGLQGAVMFLLGTLMLIVPDAIIPIWAWTLSALTSRAIGAWGIGMGTAALHAAWENDWARSSAAMVSYAAFGALQIINLIRFPDTLDWGQPSAMIYTVFMASILVVGLYGVWMTRRYMKVEEGKNRV